MQYVKTNDSRVAREIGSRALVAHDNNELNKARAARSVYKKAINGTQEVQTRIETLEKRMLNIENLLSQIASSLENKTV